MDFRSQSELRFKDGLLAPKNKQRGGRATVRTWLLLLLLVIAIAEAAEINYLQHHRQLVIQMASDDDGDDDDQPPADKTYWNYALDPEWPCASEYAHCYSRL